MKVLVIEDEPDIAERHGATIAVKSEVGNGTEVTITFPKHHS